MIKRILLLYFVGTLVNANQDASPSSYINSNQLPKGEDMNKKIKGIARGIVDKWIAEGLTITRDKVEGWIGKLDEAQAKDKEDKKKDKTVKVMTENIKQKGPEDKVTNLGENFKDVKQTLVKTFTKIGEIKCENCKKSHGDHGHKDEAPKVTKANPKNERESLENLSVEELLKKQEAIKQFLQMEKMAKLANVAKDFSELGKFKDIASLANNLKTLTKATAREEL